jgi:hypothetical protein
MKVIHQQSVGSPQEKQEKEKPGTPLYKPYWALSICWHIWSPLFEPVERPFRLRHPLHYGLPYSYSLVRSRLGCLWLHVWSAFTSWSPITHYPLHLRIILSFALCYHVVLSAVSSFDSSFRRRVHVLVWSSLLILIFISLFVLIDICDISYSVSIPLIESIFSSFILHYTSPKIVWARESIVSSLYNNIDVLALLIHIILQCLIPEPNG